jgi:hypothetical protein
VDAALPPQIAGLMFGALLLFSYYLRDVATDLVCKAVPASETPPERFHEALITLAAFDLGGGKRCFWDRRGTR